MSVYVRPNNENMHARRWAKEKFEKEWNRAATAPAVPALEDDTMYGM